MPPPPPTVPDEATGGRGHRSRLHLATTAALTLLLVVVGLDGLGLVDAFGPDQRTRTAAGAGYGLEVSAPTVTRPGLATSFEVRVRRDGGFDGPVEVAVSTELLALFDHQRLYPEPSAERTMGDLTVFELEPPTGEVVVLAFDWKAEPSRQRGGSGRVGVVDDDEVVVHVPVSVRVWP